MKIRKRLLQILLIGVFAVASTGWAAEFSIARIYIEYNQSANDLGYHVSLDEEDWKTLEIINPNVIFEVAGRGPYQNLGMTELFFEGAEPSLDEFPLEDLLALFPEGKYRFTGVTVDGTRISGRASLTHAVPEGPRVSSRVDDNTVVISWDPVTDSPEGFPDRRIEIIGYQVLVGSFQVTLPASSTKVTVPREFVRSLAPGVHPFEVLAIEKGGNQTITESSFILTRNLKD